MAVRGKPKLPWLLLLVAVTAVLPTNAVYNDNGIRLIVQNVVENNPLLAGFPRLPDNPTGRQFAVLVLIPNKTMQMEIPISGCSLLQSRGILITATLCSLGLELERITW